MSTITLSIQEVRDLIQGNFQFRQCLECGGTGELLVDGDEGIVVSSIHPDKDSMSYYQTACDKCEGLGGKIIFS